MTEAALRQRPCPVTTVTPARTGLLRRKCACGGSPGLDGECAGCREKRLQRRATGGAASTTAPPIVGEVLRSPGRPLDAATRAFMEPRFGHDFGKVRVHTDARAAESTRAVDALAYTVGQDVVFGAGQHSPGTRQGRFLLAHELSHVLQQSGGAEAAPDLVSVGHPHTMHEREADRAAGTVAFGPQERMANSAFGNLNVQLQRQGFGEVRLEEARLEEEERLRQTSGCKNQTQVVDRMRINPRKYPVAVTMYAHQIKSGDTLDGLSRKTMTDNTVHVFAHYYDEIKKLNEGINAGKIDNCVLLLRGWTDPAIGALPAKPTGALPADVQRAIATIYAEQWNTTTNGQLQQKYIWFTIRMRLSQGLHGPTLNDVLDKGGYYGIGKPLYKTALADLAKPSPTITGVINARSIVLDNWDTAVPPDAGPYYFHWTPSSTAEACFATKKDEKACAWEYAKKWGISGSVLAADGWYKKIPGDTAAPKERIGSMYIYK